MKREQLAFLIGGFAFGVLVGFGLAQKIADRPKAVAGAGAPAGTMQSAPAPSTPSGAPMMEEIGRLRKVLAVDPNNVQALVKMANLYHDAQMFSQAVEFYQRAVRVQPDDPNVLTDLATCLGAVDRNQEALDILRRAQELDPGHWQSVFNTVIVAGIKMHDFKTADAAMEKLEKMPEARPHLPGLKEALERARVEHPS